MPPEMADRESAEPPTLFVGRAALVPMHQEYFLSRHAMAQNEPFVYTDAGEEIHRLSRPVIYIVKQLLLDYFGILAFDVMVSP